MRKIKVESICFSGHPEGTEVFMYDNNKELREVTGLEGLDEGIEQHVEMSGSCVGIVVCANKVDAIQVDGGIDKFEYID